MGYTVKAYEPKYFDRWNHFVEESANGTIFHRLDFLNYHDTKFSKNEHHLIWLKGEAIVAVLPLLIKEDQITKKKIALSPYGASFGGIVVSNKINLKNAVHIIDGLVNYLKEHNISEIEMTLVPPVYNNYSNQTMEFSLLQAGFQLNKADLFNFVKLGKTEEEIWNSLEGRARTTIRKYENNFSIQENVSVDEFFPILQEDKIRHKSKPTHNLKELTYLKSVFPDSLTFDIAMHKDSGAKAGICHVLCKKEVNMTFYMSQEDNAVGSNATNILVYHAMKRCAKNGIEIFDFGSSTYGYKIENIGVSTFKESFGAKGSLRSKFKLIL